MIHLVIFSWAATRSLNPSFQSILYFYTPGKHQNTFGFLMFSRGIEVEHWLKMVKLISENKVSNKNTLCSWQLELVQIQFSVKKSKDQPQKSRCVITNFLGTHWGEGYSIKVWFGSELSVVFKSNKKHILQFLKPF